MTADKPAVADQTLITDAERMAEIRERLEAATPGPWHVVTDSCDCGGGYPCGHGSWPHAIRNGHHRMWGTPNEQPCDSDNPGDHYHHLHSELSEFPDADAELIAHAPEDIAWLLAENDALRARLAAMPEATETVEWAAGETSAPGARPVPMPSEAQARKYPGFDVYRRTVRTFAPQVGEWEEVPTDE